MLYWVLGVSYMALLFFLSSQGSHSLPQLAHGTDKLVHLLAYIPLAAFFYHAFHKSGIRKYKFIMVFLIVCLYGLSDEIHQYFVPGRDASFGDVVADSLGALIGLTGAGYAELKTRFT